MPPPNNKIKIVAIVGPTATGKSDLAVLLAQKFNGEIVSADSRQVYQGLDIGSGKVTKKEMGGIPHHMLSVANPKRTYTVSQFQKKAQKEISAIAKRGKLPIICGGSGFYLQAVVDTISFPNVPPNKNLRKKLEKQTPDKMYHTLSALDPGRAATIDRYNPRRLIRALEIVHMQGRVPKQTQKTDFELLIVGIALSQNILNERIHVRLYKRFRRGMVREVEKLHTQGVSWKRLESFGLEYGFIAKYLQKKVTRRDMEEKLEVAIRQFAKRQITWFKRDKRIVWYSPKQRKEITKAAQHFLFKND